MMRRSTTIRPMYISKFKIDSYKSFLSSEEISLTPGFNVVVGQNNIGKSSLTEALSTQFQNKPHRSMATSPEANSPSGPLSQVTLTFVLSPSEVMSIIKNQMGSFFVSHNNEGTNPDQTAANFIGLLSHDIKLECVIKPNQDPIAKVIGYDVEIDRAIQFHFDQQTNAIESLSSTGIHATPYVNHFPNQLFNLLRNRIYAFKAERFNLAESPTGANRILTPNASNLPEVLSTLSTNNPTRFKKFNQLVSTIFPQVKQVTAPPISNNTFRILIWNVDPDSEREDLAVSLQESGTGVGQILAILYVVLTANDSQTIIIDEPQSFLHPGAVRKLIDILKMYPQHQYILTTHSPTVVTSSNPSTLLMVTKEEAESKIQTIKTQETSELSKYLSEVGARLSDVFGSDNILWVEGSTEEACFPLIIRELAKLPLLGTTILGVKHTGDFEGNQSELIFEVYKRLSKGNGLLPEAIAFIFDREGRTDTQREDLERKGKGQVIFLKRRMYENYLLNPLAIASVISSLPSFASNPITSEQVSEWLAQHKWNTDFFERAVPVEKQKDELWLEKVHGAKILERIFADLSEARYSYDKVEHGELLTMWIIKNSPDDLQDIVNLLKQILQTNSLSTKNHTQS